MRMYMTSALSMSDMKGLGLQMALDAMHRKHDKDVITGLKQRLLPGRPDWHQVRHVWQHNVKLRRMMYIRVCNTTFIRYRHFVYEQTRC